MSKTLDEILASVYIAGVSGGLHRDITDPGEIRHRREGFIKANPVNKDAKQAILAAIKRAKPHRGYCAFHGGGTREPLSNNCIACNQFDPATAFEQNLMKELGL